MLKVIDARLLTWVPKSDASLAIDPTDIGIEPNNLSEWLRGVYIGAQQSNSIEESRVMSEEPDVEKGELLALTSEIVSSHVSNNPVSATDLPNLIEVVFR